VSADVFGTVSRGAAFGLEPSASMGRAGVGRFPERPTERPVESNRCRSGKGKSLEIPWRAGSRTGPLYALWVP
jgi:hypothetical protein